MLDGRTVAEDGGDGRMTKKEALKLEKSCDNLLTKATGFSCSVSQALGGNLRIQFGENNITINKYDLDTPEWVHYIGDYGELQSFISSVRVAIRKNKGLFKKLMWSYANVRELEE